MTWDPVNLAKLEERPLLTPSLGGIGLVYPGKRHVFSGPPESAKTLAAYTIALAEIRAGGVVILIDFEMGPYDARERLRDLGATDEAFAHLFYVEPEAPATEAVMRELLVWKPTLVIVDASVGAYDLQGLDDNKRKDVEQFASVWVDTFRFHDVATILLDHVPKNADGRGRFAIGSERKVGGADVHLGFEVVQPVRRGGEGLYRVIVHKDRLGHLHRPKAAEFVLTSDPETHAITATFALESSDQSEDGQQWEPTVLMQRVSEFLAAMTEPVSRNRVETSIHGRAVYLRQALDALVRGGYASETPGRAGARLYALVKPYRGGAAAPGGTGTSSRSSHLVPDDPGRPATDLVPSSHPRKGDEDEAGDEHEDGTAKLVPPELPDDAPAWERSWHERRRARAS